MTQGVSTNSFLQVLISNQQLAVPIFHHIPSLLVKYGILWKFHAKVIEVNVDRICGCVTNSINLIGGFNHPIKKKKQKHICQLFTQGGRFGTRSTQSQRLQASKKRHSRWSQLIESKTNATQKMRLAGKGMAILPPFVQPEVRITLKIFVS